jgi:primosomal protein N' (replication factor Y) (superfamily II helicase)
VVFWFAIVVAIPAHSGLVQQLTYLSERWLPAGSLVRVPFGSREVLGIVWGQTQQPESEALRMKTKAIIAALDGIAPLDAPWRALLEFAARYYQRGIGEVALAALPPQLRELDALQLVRRQKAQAKQLEKLAKEATKAAITTKANTSADTNDNVSVGINRDATTASHSDSLSLVAEQEQKQEQGISISAQQREVIAQFFAAPVSKPALLFGTTGSGKTEVYLRCTARVLESNPQAQVLVMVPEINLTPQLEARFTERFASIYGADAVVAMHSGMTPAQRLKSWLAAHTGQARIVLGTRMAVFASMPALQLIVVDEEHDPSYKSQDGARHSARDLAVMRAKLQTDHAASTAQTTSEVAKEAAKETPKPCRIMLGSATPSLETWHACETGRYLRLSMPERVGGGALAALRMVDMRTLPKKTLFAPALLEAIQQRIARGEQSLIFLNRRGYAPVLACGACDWKSDCPHCSAYRVFHKIDRTLRCHHCGTTDRVPRACPECGNIDIAPIGRGTEKLEEQLAQALGIRVVLQAAEGANVFTGVGMADEVAAPAEINTAESTLAHPNGKPAVPVGPDSRPAGLSRPDGRPAVIARMDADTTRLKGALEQQLANVHSGDVDILVGTQMIAKGHDFRRITLVAAINPDSALYSSDFRAPERLFSLLMQAAGRAGRDATLHGAQMWLQTQHPDHPLFAALKAHDYPGFAAQQLRERAQAGLPPSSYQALVRAEARTQEAAQAFLQAVSEAAVDVSAFEHVVLYPSVPMTIQRVANVERAQMLVESTSRAVLQKFLSDWQTVLRATKVQGLIRWAMDVDPLSI